MFFCSHKIVMSFKYINIIFWKNVANASLILGMLFHWTPATLWIWCFHGISNSPLSHFSFPASILSLFCPSITSLSQCFLPIATKPYNGLYYVCASGLIPINLFVVHSKLTLREACTLVEDGGLQVLWNFRFEYVIQFSESSPFQPDY